MEDCGSSEMYNRISFIDRFQVVHLSEIAAKSDWLSSREDGHQTCISKHQRIVVRAGHDQQEWARNSMQK